MEQIDKDRRENLNEPVIDSKQRHTKDTDASHSLLAFHPHRLFVVGAVLVLVALLVWMMVTA